VLPAVADFSGLHILVIEDDALGQEGLVSLLESWGCKVSVADDALTACKLLREDQCPTFIISDYRLRDGLTGIDAVGRVRNASGRDIAACLISGDTDATVRQQAKAAGLALLHKPVRPAKLRSLLRNRIQENDAR
jgi:CheY-like chemotaxis protein